MIFAQNSQFSWKTVQYTVYSSNLFEIYFQVGPKIYTILILYIFQYIFQFWYRKFTANEVK